MGLDTSHNAWHGAYGSFARWRNLVARAAGFALAEQPIDDAYPAYKTEQPDVDWDQFEPGNYQGEWAETPDEPLFALIAHSDCDGVIHPAQGKALADRLEQLLPRIAELGAEDPYADPAARTRQFIAGLRAAVAADEDLDFH